MNANERYLNEQLAKAQKIEKQHYRRLVRKSLTVQGVAKGVRLQVLKALGLK